MDGNFDFDNFITSIGTPAAVSIVVSVLANKFYFRFNKNKLQETWKQQGIPQLYVYHINSIEDLNNIIIQAKECSNFRVKFDIVENETGKTETKCEIQEILLENLDFSSKWAYGYIKNNSSVDISFYQIMDKQGAEVNVSNNWNKHLIEPGKAVGIVTERYNKPQKISLASNGHEFEYIWGNKEGIIPATMKK